MDKKITGEEGFAKSEAGRIARKILRDKNSVVLDDFRHLHTLGYLLGAHGKRVRDLVVEKFAHIEDVGGTEALISLVDREVGLHSNIPPCCVEFFVNSHDEIRTEYPYLSAAVVEHLSAGVRAYATRGLLGLSEERQPNYATCFECTRGILLGQMLPQQLHYCDNTEDSPMCAKWIKARELRLQSESHDALIFCVYPEGYFEVENKARCR